MAIWNNTYIHGILDADDGYYVTPYHYGVASYSEDEGAIVFGDSRIDTIIDGDSVAINNDLMVDSTINAQEYKIITPIGPYATLASFDNNNKRIIIGDNYKGQKTVINGANIDIIAQYSDYTLGNIDASFGNFIIRNCRLSAEGSTFNLANLDIDSTTGNYNVNISDIMDSNNGAARTVNTKINGDRVLFANSCYGTSDPPTNGREGQIYFKIVS